MISPAYIDDVMKEYSDVVINGHKLTFLFTENIIAARFGCKIVFERYLDDIWHSNICPLIDAWLDKNR